MSEQTVCILTIYHPHGILTQGSASHRVAQRSADAADARAKVHGRVLTDDETDWLAEEARSDEDIPSRSRSRSDVAPLPSRRSHPQPADLQSSAGR